MKYIDAEKLYKKVDELMAHYAKAEKETRIDDVELSIFYQGKEKMCSEVIGLITSLQQEQPEVDLEKEIDDELDRNWRGYYIERRRFVESVKYFYNLGLNARKEE